MYNFRRFYGVHNLSIHVRDVNTIESDTRRHEKMYRFSKFKRRPAQRLPCVACVTFLSVVRIKSSARSFMHIYAHIPQRIMCPRVIYRAGTCARVCTS